MIPTMRLIGCNLTLGFIAVASPCVVDSDQIYRFHTQFSFPPTVPLIKTSQTKDLS